MKLRYLAPPINGTVGCYPLASLARAMSHERIESLNNRQSRFAVFLTKTLSKLRFPHNFTRSNDGPVFIAFMGFSESRTLPFSLWTEIIPYCFDCWPPDYDRWRSFFQRHRVRLAFFTARQSAEYFARQVKDMRSIWLPEATDSSDYDCSTPLAKRSIDVLELGRKNDGYHSIIAPRLSRDGRRHLFELVKDRIIFPDRHALVAGLGNTKISVCFPCSQTHPERSGPVETVTHRYFESIASKCVLLGHCPTELKDLFGYNPVVEVEPGGEFDQIDSMLAGISQFESLAEQNYERLLQVGTWDVRVPTILEHVEEVFGELNLSGSMIASAA